MKKYLLVLLSLTCMNAFAQQPQLDPERQKRIMEILEKEVRNMPDPLARMEAEREDRIRQRKAYEEHRKHMESDEVKQKIRQMNMFEGMLKHYNKLDDTAKTAYREDMYKHGFKFFDNMKKKEPNNPEILTPSGDISKFILTYADKGTKELSEYQIYELAKNFSRTICETPQTLVLLGVDIPIEGVFSWNDKVLKTVNMGKKDCKYIDFNVK